MLEQTLAGNYIPIVSNYPLQAHTFGVDGSCGLVSINGGHPTRIWVVTWVQRDLESLIFEPSHHHTAAFVTSFFCLSDLVCLHCLLFPRPPSAKLPTKEFQAVNGRGGTQTLPKHWHWPHPIRHARHPRSTSCQGGGIVATGFAQHKW